MWRCVGFSYGTGREYQKAAFGGCVATVRAVCQSKERLRYKQRKRPEWENQTVFGGAFFFLRFGIVLLSSQSLADLSFSRLNAVTILRVIIAFHDEVAPAPLALAEPHILFQHFRKFQLQNVGSGMKLVFDIDKAGKTELRHQGIQLHAVTLGKFLMLPGDGPFLVYPRDKFIYGHSVRHLPSLHLHWQCQGKPFLPDGGRGPAPYGDGLVHKRSDGRWEGRIVVGHKEDGKRISRNVYAKTREECEAKLAALIEKTKKEMTKEKQKLKQI